VGFLRGDVELFVDCEAAASGGQRQNSQRRPVRAIPSELDTQSGCYSNVVFARAIAIPAPPWASDSIPTGANGASRETPTLEASVPNLGCFFVAIEVHFFLRMTIISPSGRPRGTAVVTGLGQKGSARMREKTVPLLWQLPSGERLDQTT
jgi:hypothetical protein